MVRTMTMFPIVRDRIGKLWELRVVPYEDGGADTDKCFVGVLYPVARDSHSRFHPKKKRDQRRRLRVADSVPPAFFRAVIFEVSYF